jgi:hypothetical protein
MKWNAKAFCVFSNKKSPEPPAHTWEHLEKIRVGSGQPCLANRPRARTLRSVDPQRPADTQENPEKGPGGSSHTNRLWNLGGPDPPAMPGASRTLLAQLHAATRGRTVYSLGPSYKSCLDYTLHSWTLDMMMRRTSVSLRLNGTCIQDSKAIALGICCWVWILIWFSSYPFTLLWLSPCSPLCSSSSASVLCSPRLSIREHWAKPYQ